MDITLIKRSPLTNDEINALPVLPFEGRIVVVKTVEQARSAAKELASEKVLGFDTETRPSFKKGEFYHVALLQLATLEKVFLFQLGQANLMPELIDLLSNPLILKVGVATRDDVKGLQLLHPFEPGGFLDIALELSELGRTPGLRALVAEFLGYRLSKAAKITNWELPRLSKAQLMYAAKDALAGLMIYLKIHSKINSQSD